MKKFHGGCHGCDAQDKYGLDYCKGCQYFDCKWDLPNLNSKSMNKEKQKIEEIREELVKHIDAELFKLMCVNSPEPPKPEYKVNDWVICNSDIVQINRFIEDVWFIGSGDFELCSINDITRCATDKEIFDHLMGEAEKQGWKVGSRFNWIGCGDLEIVKHFRLSTIEKRESFEVDKYHKKHGIHLVIEFGSDQMIPLNKCTQIKDKLTFGGVEVKRKGFSYFINGEGVNKSDLQTLLCYANRVDVDLDSPIKINSITGTWRELETILNKL